MASRLGRRPNALKGQEFAMANHFRRFRGMFRGFDFLSAFVAFLFGSRMELKPIPVRVRARRR